MISLTSSFAFAESSKCLTKDEAASLAAEQFVGEYYGTAGTDLFPVDMFFHFYELSGSEETMLGAKSEYFDHASYRFNQAKSLHIFNGMASFDGLYDDANAGYGLDYSVYVTCSGKISVKSYMAHD
jgi:hypothetical protein